MSVEAGDNVHFLFVGRDPEKISAAIIGLGRSGLVSFPVATPTYGEIVGIGWARVSGLAMLNLTDAQLRDAVNKATDGVAFTYATDGPIAATEATVRELNARAETWFERQKSILAETFDDLQNFGAGAGLGAILGVIAAIIVVLLVLFYAGPAIATGIGRLAS